jgi:divalent metal cation (Fe/Co/Zn/Cd) transporter
MTLSTGVSVDRILYSLRLPRTFDAAHSLWTGERAAFSLVGIVRTSVSLVVMMWLARAKQRVARALDSRTLEADAFQTTACWWLSLAALVGVTLNGALGWWWADPAAALVAIAAAQALAAAVLQLRAPSTLRLPDVGAENPPDEPGW